MTRVVQANDKYRSSEVIHGWQGEHREFSRRPAVNNFVAPRKVRGPFRMVWHLEFHYPCSLVFRTGGSGLLTTSRFERL